MLQHVEASAGDWIKGLMLRMHVNQKQLASVLGVHPVTVARWVGGHRMSGKYRTRLNDIARVHNYPPLAPPRRRKAGKKQVVVHLPDGWKERAEREDNYGNQEGGKED